MQDTVNQTPAGDVERLLELLYDLGESVVGLTTQVAVLQARVDELTAVQATSAGGAR